jgi:hypothetical protein
MRYSSAIICICLLGYGATGLADDLPDSHRQENHDLPAVEPILREAAELAMKQDQPQRFWTERVLLTIGETQIRSSDFDGALRSIRASGYWYGRNANLAHLSEAVARAGNRKRAFEILHMLDPDHGWRQVYMEDRVQLNWLEYLIASSELDRASKAIESIKTARHRSEAFRKLAVAYAKSGAARDTSKCFQNALGAAILVDDESDRARAFWEIADAQLATGDTANAKQTIQHLLKDTKLKEPWTTFSALLQAAIFAAKTKDDEMARRLFAQAIEARNAVNSLNKSNAIKLIAIDQASVGFIDDALKTISIIRPGEGTFVSADFDLALHSIAASQLKAKDIQGAKKTYLLIKNYPQYRDDTLHDIVDFQIANRDLKGALATTEGIDNPSRKAAVILKIATAHAKAGDRKKAVEIAENVELKFQDRLLGMGGKGLCFDFRRPESWGELYDSSVAFTMASHHYSVERAQEVAGAAMSLAQALGQKPKESYAVLFNSMVAEEVTRAVARAHAATGDANEALAWARKVGRGDTAVPNDSEHMFAIGRRIHALLGVAEGILDRTEDKPAKPTP